MKDLKKTLVIIGLINIVVILAIYILLSKFQPVPLPVEIKALEFQSLFPNNNYSEITNKEWLGYQFKGSLRILYKDVKPGSNSFMNLSKNSFKKFHLKENLPLYDRGVYVIKKKYRGYIITTVFQKGNRIFWIDKISNSTLDFNQNLFHQLLINLKINGDPVQTEISEKLKEISSKTSILVIQSIELFLIFFNLLLLFILSLVYLIFYFLTAPPANLNSGVYRICTRDASYAHGNRMRKYSPVCLCKENHYLHLYRFRKKIMTIDLSKLKTPLVRKRKFLVFNEITLRISDEDLNKFHLQAYIKNKQ
jgi:hypothetical protein